MRGKQRIRQHTGPFSLCPCIRKGHRGAQCRGHSHVPRVLWNRGVAVSQGSHIRALWTGANKPLPSLAGDLPTSGACGFPALLASPATSQLPRPPLIKSSLYGKISGWLMSQQSDRDAQYSQIHPTSGRIGLTQ